MFLFRRSLQRLGVSLSAAKSRVQRGRALLKGELERCCRFKFERRSNLTELTASPVEQRAEIATFKAVPFGR